MSKEDHTLFEAARYLDASAEESMSEGGMEAFCKKMNLPPAERALYLANQRAKRAALIQTGEVKKLEEMSRTEITRIELSNTQERIRKMLEPSIYDALMIGWKAHEMSLIP